MEKEYVAVAKITLACPGNCPGCSSRKLGFQLKGNGQTIMSLEYFEKICQELKMKNGKYICLSGGEPTTVKELTSYIRIAKKYGLVVRINTNGWGITEEKLREWLNNGLNQITLSLYGLTREKVREYRGNEKIFEKSMEALKVIKKLKEEYEFLFIIQTIILPNNYKDLPKLLELAIDSKADILWPSYLEDAVNHSDMCMSSEDVVLFKEEILESLKECLNNKIKNKNIIKKNEEQMQKFFKEEDTIKGIYHDENFKCGLLGRFMLFYPNGLIAPCPGHEYFISGTEFNFDEKNGVGDLERFINNKYEFCKYCAQGAHVGFNLSKENIDEHK